MKKMPSKVGYSSKNEEIVPSCPDCQKRPKTANIFYEFFNGILLPKLI